MFSSGTKTFGTAGADYPNLSSASVDLTDLTGNVTLTAIDDWTDVAQAAFAQNLNGFNLHITSLPHWGNWNNGHLGSVTLNDNYINVSVTGPGNLEIDNLKIQQISTSGGSTVLIASGVTANVTANLIHDLMIDGMSTRWPDTSQICNCFALGLPYGNESPHTYCWNCVALNGVYGYLTNIMDPTSVIENCVATGGWIGYELYGESGSGGPIGDELILRNCVAYNGVYENSWTDFGEGVNGTPITVATFLTCASQDNDGTPPFNNLTWGQFVEPTTKTNPAFLDIRVDSVINSAGVNQKYLKNNRCIRGRSRPDTNGRQTIGAAENPGLIIRSI
jgi:hypothetical protein